VSAHHEPSHVRYWRRIAFSPTTGDGLNPDKGPEPGRGRHLTHCMVRPCVARGFLELVVCGLASMYPAFDWSSFRSRPSWISARMRSHYRTGLNGPLGSPVFARAGKTDPPSRCHPLADLGR
jgi:hypothetical protein